MRDFFEELRLDQELTELDYSACLGFGRAYERQAESETSVHRRREFLFAAASSYRQAGADAMLLGNSKDMSGSFHEAGRTYANLGTSYTVLMRALTNTPWEETREHNSLEAQDRSPKYFGLREGEGEAAYVVLADLRP